MKDRPQPLTEHLQELRQRIIYSLIAVGLGIGLAAAYAHRALTYILHTAAADGVRLVQNNFADTFLTEFHLAVIGGMVLASPFVIYQVVAFVLPALHPAERRLLYIGLPAATLLFVVGCLFGWFVVVPITRSFFTGLASSAGVQNQITPSGYIQFIVNVCLPLGASFELPLLVLILARIGLVTAGFLRRIRKFAFLGLLIVAAVLSPPDMISMMIFFVPLYGLYELSVLVAHFGGKSSS